MEVGEEAEHDMAIASSQKFKGIISGCFEPYMGFYTGEVKDRMKATYLGLIQAENWILPEGDTTKVFSSSIGLMKAFNQLRTRCKKAGITQYAAYVEMFNLIKHYLSEYANFLMSKIK